MNKYPEILTIQSDINELKKVENFLRLLFQKEKLPEEQFNRVWLCVSEAVVNSIEHGNRNEKHKKVTIEIECFDKELYIAVTDEGDGFNFQEVADPTFKDNINKETGRGIYIMKSICDLLTFREKGNCVEIKIEIE